MTTQREGFLGDIVDKVKDLLDSPEPKKTPEPEDPPLTPQCCGPNPPGWPIMGGHKVVTEGPVEHELNCPNHPDNVAKEEVAS
ncbi:hypothetical protein BBK82_21375 [Lentzea guizhouensis]|uniref:Uncharacterized protein n=1 Tax=Lentzea guizhouensis TaxID=1586287 RepID=A0A1B2HKI2_9PSEU|nr:hypothetical protein [Lentzea guizhouensis]ANZ38238.1 hypothetical protein BBK82_21375 [Lentzea guizhouensis]